MFVFFGGYFQVMSEGTKDDLRIHAFFSPAVAANLVELSEVIFYGFAIMWMGWIVRYLAEHLGSGQSKVNVVSLAAFKAGNLLAVASLVSALPLLVGLRIRDSILEAGVAGFSGVLGKTGTSELGFYLLLPVASIVIGWG